MQNQPNSQTIVRGHVFHCLGNPFDTSDAQALDSIPNGAIAFDTQTGKITAVGTYQGICAREDLAGTKIIDRRESYIFPGFVDCHAHYPQTMMIAAYGEHLLEWLDKYTFPEELKYRDPNYAQSAADLFFDQLLASGTTCVNVFGSQFPPAMNIAFEAAQRRRIRAIMGLNLSDRNIPPALRLLPNEALVLSLELIKRWHGQSNGKLRYAVTPRFAPTSTPEQLQVCRQLLVIRPGLYMHTHLSENVDEIRWMSELFPEQSYLDVYAQFGLIGKRCIFAHCVHCTNREIARLAQADCSVVHCPSSNMFLGSGLMPLKLYLGAGMRVGLGTDVAGGTGFSINEEMSHAYKMQMLLSQTNPLLGTKLSGVRLLYLATLGGARALHFDDEIGNFQPGKSADFVVIDPSRGTYLPHRLLNTSSADEVLFVLAMMGRQQHVREVYIDGCLAHSVSAR